MAFELKNINSKPVKGEKFELIKHSSGKVGMILSIHFPVMKQISGGNRINDTEFKVAVFDRETTGNYGCWFKTDCTSFDGEILLKNEQ